MPQQITKRSTAESHGRGRHRVLFDFEDPFGSVRDGEREEMAQGDHREKRREPSGEAVTIIP